MTHDQEFVNEVIYKRVSPRLKQAGYRKNAFRFYCEFEDIVHLVDVQVGRSDRNSFTYNFGVFDAEAWKCVWGGKVPRCPGPEDCFPSFRIGQLMASESRIELDKWWNAGDAAQVDDAMEKLDLIGLPFLSGFKSRCGVARWATRDTQGPPGLVLLAAATCAIAGDLKKSQEFLSILDKPQMKAWQPRIEIVRKLISA